MKVRIGMFAVALTVFGVVSPAPASAASSQATTGSNCVYLLVPVTTTADGTLATPSLIGCYSTYAAALSAGSDGAIQLPTSITPATLTDKLLLQATVSLSPTADVLIGTEWNLNTFGGDSNSYMASSTCSNTQSWSTAYVGDAVNDTYQSGKGFGGCDTNKKFEDANFGGSNIVCTPNCADYGSLRNEVSSLKWKP
ncbi:MAG: hypothetical protein QOI81_1693 [Actinomycetota bacterium]|jgi:hypothetical protein|nr:hypothetical protein [Actinomycetota bacterium]